MNNERSGDARPAKLDDFSPWFGIRPNSRTHRALLWLGLIGGVAFNAGILIDGAFRPGYDWLTQPMSALSLGRWGWIQIGGFVAFGIVQCLTAAAWRASLVRGVGVTAIPILTIVTGITMIAAGIFTQDPGLGYPAGVATPTLPTPHALIHQGVAVVSLTATIATLIALAVRFSRSIGWQRWAPWAIACGVGMMASLAVFGVLISNGGPGGIFEKLASWIPTAYGLFIVARLLQGDSQVSPPDRSAVGSSNGAHDATDATKADGTAARLLDT